MTTTQSGSTGVAQAHRLRTISFITLALAALCAIKTGRDKMATRDLANATDANATAMSTMLAAVGDGLESTKAALGKVAAISDDVDAKARGTAEDRKKAEGAAARARGDADRSVSGATQSIAALGRTTAALVKARADLQAVTAPTSSAGAVARR